MCQHKGIKFALAHLSLFYFCSSQLVRTRSRGSGMATNNAVLDLCSGLRVFKYKVTYLDWLLDDLLRLLDDLFN